MRSKIIAISLLAILMMSGFMALASESDGSDDSETYWWTDEDLYHSTAKCLASAPTSPYEWVYPIGEDESMKKFLADPLKNPVPARGLTSVQMGVTYEVYYLQKSNTFDIEQEEIVMKKTPLNITVEPNSVKKMTVNSMICSSKSGIVSVPAYNLLLVYSDGHYDSTIHIVTDTANLNYKEGTHYEISAFQYSQAGLIYVMDCNIATKTFTGSPYLYIGICVVVTALVALTVAVCGRRPKFD